MWLAKFGVLPDSRHLRLLWPGEQSEIDQITNKGLRPIPRSILQRDKQINKEHQEDANRRDQQIDKEIKKEKMRGLWRLSTTPSSTYLQDHQNALRSMERALHRRDNSLSDNKTPAQKEHIKKYRDMLQIDIQVISSAAFNRFYLKKKDTQVFITSLAEIDRVIEEKVHKQALSHDQTGEPEAAGIIKKVCWADEVDKVIKPPQAEIASLNKETFVDEIEDLKRSLPECYHDYLDVFSKVASDSYPLS